VIKNKAFFFIDYEGTQQRGSGPATATVAPAAWRTGDLSEFSHQGQPGGERSNYREPVPGQYRACFADHQSVAAKLFGSPDLYPLPNNIGTGALGITNNYIATSASTLKNNQADVKGDIRPTDKTA